MSPNIISSRFRCKHFTTIDVIAHYCSCVSVLPSFSYYCTGEVYHHSNTRHVHGSAAILWRWTLPTCQWEYQENASDAVIRNQLPWTGLAPEQRRRLLDYIYSSLGKIDLKFDFIVQARPMQSAWTLRTNSREFFFSTIRTYFKCLQLRTLGHVGSTSNSEELSRLQVIIITNSEATRFICKAFFRGHSWESPIPRMNIRVGIRMAVH